MSTPSRHDRRALIVGTSGIAGAALAEHLDDQGWEVWGLSRGPKRFGAPVQHVRADLEDPTELAARLSGVRPTHVFYAAWKRHSTEAENIAVNGTMVDNVLTALGVQDSVQHVALVTGLKHYIGSPDVQGRIEVPETPFREDVPRRSVPNFYYAQEDALFAAAQRFGFTWSVHRAHTIVGHAVGNAMNMGLTLAVQAALCRQRGEPFVFPGSGIRWNGLGDMTDAGLLARHMTWAATTPTAADEAYNVVNGDVFRWRAMWPRLAEMLDVEPEGFDGGPRPLAVQMAGAEDAWRQIALEHGLVEPDLHKVASWWHTDGDLGRGIEMLADMSKSRLAGFTDYVRTEDSFRRLFGRYVADRVLPAPGEPRRAPAVQTEPVSVDAE
ncbi:SDR family oxidoreductase [Georgenia subflava]|uniref:NAD-dependent epimerase/dehydratase family protein n=1 Tax=Georgenia subflava TaxID=1622177 RepID=A0A6N7EC62_9MICO|nr:SDR family oxidoreductase [Georgenia subflava]MPV35560.1 NAD-dependent epimerase/dehydratase family protein [Georgenia subflava]